MKYNYPIYAVVFLFLLPSFLIAQEKIEVMQKTVTMSKGEQPAYMVKVPEAEYEKVVGNWTKIIRQNTKSKVEETEHEINIIATEISEIIHKPINIYSAVIKADSSVKIFAVFEIDSVFFTLNEESKTIQNEKTHHHIQHFMKNFAVDQYTSFVEVELEDAEAILKTKNKEIKDISKQIESSQKEIKESEQKIKNSEDLISSYEIDNERKLGEINNKKASMSALSGDPDLYSQAKDQLKALEKEKKSIQNKLEKEQKNIVSEQSNIEELTRLIEDNKEIQVAKKDEVEKQEDIISSIKTKLEGIK